jgi:hypothetical protein
MARTRTLWIFEALASAVALALVYRALASDGTGALVGIELALFATAFLLTAGLGGAGKVLALGAGLGFGFATLLSVGGASGFFSPGELFVIGLIVAGALYPGWALGVGVGALARGMGSRRSSR